MFKILWIRHCRQTICMFTLYVFNSKTVCLRPQCGKHKPQTFAEYRNKTIFLTHVCVNQSQSANKVMLKCKNKKQKQKTM